MTNLFRKFQKCNLIFVMDTQMDGRMDVCTFGFLLGTYSVRKNSQERESTQQILAHFYGINLIEFISSLYMQMRFIWKFGRVHSWVWMDWRTSPKQYAPSTFSKLGDMDLPWKITKNIVFLSNTDLDPLENHKATKPAFNVGPSSPSQWNAI